MSSTLDQVATAFSHWRATRSKRGRIPHNLITEAISLSGRYSQSDIIRRLGINHSTLRRWTEQQHSQATFVTLDAAVSDQSTPTIQGPFEVSIQFPSGSQLVLNGHQSEAVAFVMELRQRGVL